MRHPCHRLRLLFCLYAVFPFPVLRAYTCVFLSFLRPQVPRPRIVSFSPVPRVPLELRYNQSDVNVIIVMIVHVGADASLRGIPVEKNAGSMSPNATVARVA